MQHSEVRLHQSVAVRDPDGRWPGIWTVEKINPKNIKLQQIGEHGVRRYLNAHPSYLTLADDTTPAPVGRPYRALFEVGTLVNWENVKGGAGTVLYVVLKDNGDKVNIIRVGGEGGRYWRITDGVGLTEVKPAEALIERWQQP